MTQKEFMSYRPAHSLKNRILSRLNNLDEVTPQDIKETVEAYIVMPELRILMTRWIESLVTVTIHEVEVL